MAALDSTRGGDKTILRLSKIAVMSDIYDHVSSMTREAPKRLGNQFGEEVL